MRMLVCIAVALALGWWLAGQFPSTGQGYAPRVVPGQSIDAEKAYHAQIFDYVMDTVATDKPYEWQAYATRGSISAGTVYVSKSGSTCRNYQEHYTLAGKTVLFEGVACKRQGNEGWCRLKPSNALTCALETPSTIVELPNANVSLPGVRVGSGPDVDLGGGVSAPDVDVNMDVDTGDGGGSRKTTGSDIATDVTGTAGKAAGSFTGGAIKWFGRTFGGD